MRRLAGLEFAASKPAAWDICKAAILRRAKQKGSAMAGESQAKKEKRKKRKRVFVACHC